jgi:hypothetical protein
VNFKLSGTKESEHSTALLLCKHHLANIKEIYQKLKHGFVPKLISRVGENNGKGTKEEMAKWIPSP